ncbi:S9 family peptidase [uncultured Algimonas sp.]|uniref:S9 family peptidase n=1 Tax=uncultured Algimonas sp. TaxID=1547920 RepID=UPI002605816B|nr:S9 family peptidase [uncultured Algimonas sp.]
MTHTPPRADKRPLAQSRFGHDWSDDYAWLKDENWQAVLRDPAKLSPDIRAHLEAENAYTQTVLGPLSDLEETLFEEMKGRLEPARSSTKLPDGPWRYYHRYEPGHEHGTYMREPRDGGQAVTLLDAETLSEGADGFFDIGDVSHSPDHARLAYGLDLKGSENNEVFIKTAEGAEARFTGIDKAAGALVWAADSETLFWVERDENQRPSAVRYRSVDADGEGRLAYEESDPGFFVGVGTSDDDRHITISAHDHTTSEVWAVPMDDPARPPVCFAPRRTGVEYSVSPQDGRSYILSNDRKAVDFAVFQSGTPLGEASDPAEWQSFIDHEPGRLILGLETYAGHMVRLERINALPRIVVRDMESSEEHGIEMDEPAYSLGLVGGYEYDTTTLHYSYSSPTTPASVYAYDMASRERTLMRRQSVPSGHDPADYATQRIEITARDGQSVPVTLLYKRGIEPDGTNPLLLYGYGSYGHTIPADFRTARLSLVDRGVVYAVAHIRGGMAKGYGWYEAGKLAGKVNTFNDFVDAGRALADLGWTARGRIIAHGGSAGGLLVGAALNQDPGLFGAVIGAVPFVDVLNTMSDADLPLTPPEWPEWGNPLEDETAFRTILSYSPYENVMEADYPPVLITGGLTDPRVTYWEPAKWAATLRDHQTGEAPILLKMNMDAGHQGESGRYKSLKETATEYAFALMAVGLS